MNADISIHHADPRGERAADLIRTLLREEAMRYADLGPDTFDTFSLDDLIAGRGVFLIANLNGEPVGCGALRPIDSKTAEINRMYVLPVARRRGIARAVLIELERCANIRGFRTIRAETGNRQPEAIAFYENRGFQLTAPFGSHADDPVSVFFEKTLV